MPPAIRVEIVPYSATWPESARQEIDHLTLALGSALSAIHHIGSTAIPGLGAKPIIDLMPVFTDIELLDDLLPALANLGYQCWGELGIPGRRYLTKNSETGTRLVQLHGFQLGSLHIERHLAFRDYLRANPGLLGDYQTEKLRCACLHPADSHAYSDCKADWIIRVELKAIDWYRSFST